MKLNYTGKTGWLFSVKLCRQFPTIMDFIYDLRKFLLNTLVKDSKVILIKILGVSRQL